MFGLKDTYRNVTVILGNPKRMSQVKTMCISLSIKWFFLKYSLVFLDAGTKELVEEKRGIDGKYVVPACFEGPFSETVKSREYTRSIKLHFS
ncbi:hypothetical protein RJT34_12621 [Clitoria ternatea]|uniref:Uncharacterized protein n=1 Tax=Clitoria ternatea TaxID=43366 RepID=A0AAN9JQ56_CLITE